MQKNSPSPLIVIRSEIDAQIIIPILLESSFFLFRDDDRAQGWE